MSHSLVQMQLISVGHLSRSAWSMSKMDADDPVPLVAALRNAGVLCCSVQDYVYVLSPKGTPPKLPKLPKLPTLCLGTAEEAPCSMLRHCVAQHIEACITAEPSTRSGQRVPQPKEQQLQDNGSSKNGPTGVMDGAGKGAKARAEGPELPFYSRIVPEGRPVFIEGDIFRGAAKDRNGVAFDVLLQQNEPDATGEAKVEVALATELWRYRVLPLHLPLVEWQSRKYESQGALCFGEMEWEARPNASTLQDCDLQCVVLPTLRVGKVLAIAKSIDRAQHFIQGSDGQAEVHFAQGFPKGSVERGDAGGRGWGWGFPSGEGAATCSLWGGRCSRFCPLLPSRLVQNVTSCHGIQVCSGQLCCAALCCAVLCAFRNVSE